MSFLTLIVLLLEGLCVLGILTIALSVDRGIVPKRLSKPWIWSGIVAYATSALLFLGMWGLVLLGYPDPFLSFAELAEGWLPPENPAFVSGIVIFGPMAVVPLLWGAVGVVLLPHLGWDLVAGRGRRRHQYI